MKRMNFPHRREKRKVEAENRNSKTPVERTRVYRLREKKR